MILVILVGIVVLFITCITIVIDQRDVIEVPVEHQEELSEIFDDEK